MGKCKRRTERTCLWLEDDEVVLDREAYGGLLPSFHEREDDVIIYGPVRESEKG